MSDHIHSSFGFSERMIRKCKATKTNDAALFPSMSNELIMSCSYPNEIGLFSVFTQGFLLFDFSFGKWKHSMEDITMMQECKIFG